MVTLPRTRADYFYFVYSFLNFRKMCAFMKLACMLTQQYENDLHKSLVKLCNAFTSFKSYLKGIRAAESIDHVLEGQ